MGGYTQIVDDMVKRFAQIAVNLDSSPFYCPVSLGKNGRLKSCWHYMQLADIGHDLLGTPRTKRDSDPNGNRREAIEFAEDILDTHRRAVNAEMKRLLQEKESAK